MSQKEKLSVKLELEGEEIKVLHRILKEYFTNHEDELQAFEDYQTIEPLYNEILDAMKRMHPEPSPFDSEEPVMVTDDDNLPF